MKLFLVVTPEYGTVVPILDDGTGPMEYGADVFEVEAESKADAKVMAVRHWRSIGARWLDDAACPFTGLRVEEVPPDEAPYCPDHGTMIPDDEMGRSWHCVCDRKMETP